MKNTKNTKDMKEWMFGGKSRVCRGMLALIAFCLVMLSGCDTIMDVFNKFNEKNKKSEPVVDVPKPGEPVEWTPTTSGYYLVELWGAEGWNPPPSVDPDNQYGGRGAYVRGILELTPEEVEDGIVLTVEVAQVGGSSGNGQGGTGGGGSNASSGASDAWSATGIHEGGGGGASDIRWGGNTLHDRIIVAAGGGGANDTSKCGSSVFPATLPPFWKGGYGGALTGGDSNAWVTGDCPNGDVSAPGYGATQTAGGKGGAIDGGAGAFGKGGSYGGIMESSGAGGGGYWGGGSGGQLHYNGGGGGGSSFISGYAGCVAIASPTSTAPRTDADPVKKATHYSGKVFIQMLRVEKETYTTTMIAGDEEMPAPGGGREIGHSGDGYARITYLGK
jgi:hypothetical protein